MPSGDDRSLKTTSIKMVSHNHLRTEDEEGDDITFTWKDGDKVLGTCSPFEYGKLGAGKHTITVVADDGTGVTEQTLGVTVTEESPGVGLVAALAAMVLASLVAFWRRVS